MTSQLRHGDESAHRARDRRRERRRAVLLGGEGAQRVFREGHSVGCLSVWLRAGLATSCSIHLKPHPITCAISSFRSVPSAENAYFGRGQTNPVVTRKDQANDNRTAALAASQPLKMTNLTNEAEIETWLTARLRTPRSFRDLSARIRSGLSRPLSPLAEYPAASHPGSNGNGDQLCCWDATTPGRLLGHCKPPPRDSPLSTGLTGEWITSLIALSFARNLD